MGICEKTKKERKRKKGTFLISILEKGGKKGTFLVSILTAE